MIRLEFNSSLVEYYTEIDAVLLVGCTKPPDHERSRFNPFSTDLGTNVDTGLPETAPSPSCSPRCCCDSTASSSPSSSLSARVCDIKNCCTRVHCPSCGKRKEVDGGQKFEIGQGDAGTDFTGVDVAQEEPVVETLTTHLAKLHVQDGLSAVLEFADNGHFDQCPVSLSWFKQWLYFFYYCQDCPRYPAHFNSTGWATWEILAAINNLRP